MPIWFQICVKDKTNPIERDKSTVLTDFIAV